MNAIIQKLETAVSNLDNSVRVWFERGKPSKAIELMKEASAVRGLLEAERKKEASKPETVTFVNEQTPKPGVARFTAPSPATSKPKKETDPTKAEMQAVLMLCATAYRAGRIEGKTAGYKDISAIFGKSAG